ncbi:uncharacterized protein LOC113279460 [Papaver somniferum]|uniref:uncharacterized protein LOC113279460 n=1 Tax=Papaver somniferum TaxID=3469 RepID=UPI000E704C23|nr:uncharacterized protein LOC113279460 [Papaver somniferum]
MGGNICKHIQGVNVECRLCNGVVETIDHLFLHCQASQVTLFASPMSLRINNAHNTVEEYINLRMEAKDKYASLKMGACVFWAIWKAGNSVVFDKGSFIIQAVIQEAMYWYNLDTKPYATSTLPTESDILDSHNDQWIPPHINTIKINFDGAAGPKGFACSAVARDSTSSFQGCQTKTFQYNSAVEAETNGSLLALELARNRDFKDIILEGDSLIIINSLRYSSFQTHWKIRNTLSRLKDLVLHFNFVSYQYIKKEANSVAHLLAAHAVSTHSSNEWYSSPSSCITHLFERMSTSV